MKIHTRFNQKGDTIVEVLIVLAVLSLAFALSAATANKALQQARLAEEHSQARGIINEQAEFLRKALDNESTLTDVRGESFCMVNETTSNHSGVGNCVSITNPGISTGNPGLRINLSGDETYYRIQMTWDGPGSTGRQKESYNYRVYPNRDATPSPGDSVIVSPNGSPPQGGGGGGGFTNDPPTQASITVVAKKIPPRPGNVTPPCSDAASQDRANTTVRLTNLNNGSVLQRTTNSSSVAAFAIPEAYFNNTYRPQIVAPAQYGVCPPNPSANVLANEPPQTINMKIYPICYQQYSHTNPGYYSVGNRRPDIDGAYMGFGGGYPYLSPTTPYGSYRAPGTFFYYLWWDQAPTYYYYGYNYITSFNNWLYNGPAWGHYFVVYEAIWNPPVAVYTNVCPS